MQTIEIKTTQNVTIEYELASLWERGLSTFIDLCIISLACLLVPLGLSALGLAKLISFQLIFMICFVSFFFGYFFLLESIMGGQTLGKRIMNIRVVRLDGEIPTVNDYLLRAVFQYVDTILSAGILAAMLISSTTRQQRMGDMTAGTTVIRKRNNLRVHLKSVLNIDTRENYEPVYPQVKILSEQDMLTIKQVISRLRKYPNDAHGEVAAALASSLKELLDIRETQQLDDLEFLRTLLRDYIVLTR
ncbi:MAG: RDD family protein [Haliscomenobacter sp.]|nr:RDD family protein [Haliscomenobacter sp.]MBK9487599.1 RDD family protein [Haliscomenobacter sp.]